MPAVTEAAVVKYSLVAGVVFAAGVWATTVQSDLSGVKAAQADVRAAQAETNAELVGIGVQIQRLREAMIRAGTALPDSKGD